MAKKFVLLGTLFSGYGRRGHRGCLPALRVFLTGHTGADTATDVSLHGPPMDRLNPDPFTGRDDLGQLGRRRILLAMLGNHPHDPLTNLGLNLLRQTA